MSSQPSSPAPAPDSSQQQSDNNGQAPSSPQSKADSAVQVDESSERADPDSSFQSNSSERHPKGKRKRTDAKDKAILEAAYNANPKPDKAARLDIVKRVSLNEKEVQIWFQNRRQNDRRKSRPLSPQEIAALQYGGMQVLSSSDPVQYSSQPPVSSLPIPNTSPVPTSSLPERENPSPPSTAEPVRPSTAIENMVQAAETHHTRRVSTASMPAPLAPSPRPIEFVASQAHQLYRSASVGYFANRLHAGMSYQANRQSPDSLRHEFMSAARPSSVAPVLPPPHPSGFRLSMSMEGKAELRPQPSPPRISTSDMSDRSVPAFDRPNFHRSCSAAASITLPPISTLTASLETHAPPQQARAPHQSQPRLPPRLHHVRSLDVREWELACEASSGELKDELTAYAERESSGSAIAAISLLRSLSSSSHSPGMSPAGNISQPNGAKRNARSHPQHHSAKRPKISRASSSVARLQTSYVSTTTAKPPVRREETPVEPDEPKKSKMSLLLSPGGDSDKENWNPQGLYGAIRPSNGRRPLPGAPLSKPQSTAPAISRRSMARVLGDASNRTFLGRASTAPTLKQKKGRPTVQIFEDGTGEANASDDEDHDRRARDGVMDDEVERFMRGEVSPSKKGAASAIAGLLALSQGNWR